MTFRAPPCISGGGIYFKITAVNLSRHVSRHPARKFDRLVLAAELRPEINSRAFRDLM